MKFEVLTGEDAERARLAFCKLQVWCNKKNEWRDRDRPDMDCDPYALYRIKPELKTRRVPLSPEDITPGTAIRHPDWIFVWRWAMVRPGTVGVCSVGAQTDDAVWTWEQLMDRYEYSTDLGKTWKPCWKEVEV